MEYPCNQPEQIKVNAINKWNQGEGPREGKLYWEFLIVQFKYKNKWKAQAQKQPER